MCFVCLTGIVCAVLVSISLILIVVVMFILMIVRHKKKWTITSINDSSNGVTNVYEVTVHDDPLPLPSDYDYCTTTNEQLETTHESTNNEEKEDDLPFLYSLVEKPLNDDSVMAVEEPFIYSDVVQKPLNKHTKQQPPKDDQIMTDEEPFLYSVVEKPSKKVKQLPNDNSLMAVEEPFIYSVVQKPLKKEPQSPTDDSIMAVEEPLVYSVVQKQSKKDTKPQPPKDDSVMVDEEPFLYSVVEKPLKKGTKQPSTSPNASMEPDHEAYDVLSRDTQPCMTHPQQQYEDGVTYDILLRERRMVTTDYTIIAMNDQEDTSI